MGARAGEMKRRDQPAAGRLSQDPEEIQARIEQTRAEMSETVDAIQEQLSPARIRQQVMGTIREAAVGRTEQMVHDASQTARGFGSNLMETIRENPLPAALAGIGIGWLMMKSSGSPRTEMRYSQTRRQAGEMMGEGRQRAEQMADQARHQAEELRREAQETAEQMTSEARHQAERLGGQAQYQAQRASDRFQQMLHENPLAVGALALAAGAAIGLALPETEQERQWMGETRDTLMEKAQAKAEETTEKVQRVAEEAQRAATQAAEEEAKEQGLTK